MIQSLRFRSNSAVTVTTRFFLCVAMTTGLTLSSLGCGHSDDHPTTPSRATGEAAEPPELAADDFETGESGLSMSTEDATVEPTEEPSSEEGGVDGL